MKSSPAKLTKAFLNEILESVADNDQGRVTDYIPELADVDPDLIGIVAQTVEGKTVQVGNALEHNFSLQSISKLIVLIGLLEGYGLEQLLQWVRVEPSGSDFSSVARLDQFGPIPSNPMLNAGAIALCSHIPGNIEEKIRWIEDWMAKILGEKPNLNAKVFASERRTGGRNRSLAYLMESNGLMEGDITETLETYFALCSFEVTLPVLARLPTLLANGGQHDGKRVLSENTVAHTVSIMATCGLYNESGAHLVQTGMPAKSSVSGLMVAVLPGKVGITVASPRVNTKGNSVRGEQILIQLSQALHWHFALP